MSRAPGRNRCWSRGDDWVPQVGRHLSGDCKVILQCVAFIGMFVGGNAWSAAGELGLRVVDADTGQPLAARVYLTGAGESYFFSATGAGRAVPYRKQNWINARSMENHTCVSAHRCVAEVPAGEYRVVVHRGQAYRPYTATWQVPAEGAEKNVRLKRWADPAGRGWYSGDTHIHRSIEELRTIQLAEDLNVTFPLTNWVTLSERLPASGDRSEQTELPPGLVRIDDTHVLWPRNTEYEIFTVGEKRHTLGALFVLGHSHPLQQTVPPWQEVVAANQSPQVLFDMDKLDWPFAMLLPTIAPGALYELSNNHTWRTEFAFRQWNTQAPPFLHPPFGSHQGGHRAWLDYTMGMYYTLLNCGFRLPPSAGTANGVHPVPAGFGRVYVHLDQFRYEDWVSGLAQGRSFVSTGPMLFAKASGHHPGHKFSVPAEASIPVEAEIQSTAPISYAELLWNGRPVRHWRGGRKPNAAGVYLTQLGATVEATQSGWFAVRCWQERPDGNTRFAHSAPWYVEVGEQPIRPTRTERDYLVARMDEEIARSEEVVSPSALAEYHTAREFYRRLPVKDDPQHAAHQVRPEPDAQKRARWLKNMIVHHRFTTEEVHAVLGISREEARREVDRLVKQQAVPFEKAPLRVLPYPGGRHPRRGFLEGAIAPQRDTKVSVFPPWDDGGYVVVDVPEAVFSNLGLLYLAHTHIPTIWDAQGTPLPPVEWKEGPEGLSSTRRLPNGIEIVSRVQSVADEVRMEMTLHNAMSAGLTGLRVQVCTMLKGAQGFQLQESLEQVSHGDLLAVKAPESERWIVTGWQPRQRMWTNPPVPCFHVDPQFPDCGPGETVRVKGRLFFYEGQDIVGELRRRQ